MQVSSLPWSLDNSTQHDGTRSIIDNDGCIIASVQPALFHTDGITEDRQEANAKMLLMAPTMLDGLRVIASQSLGDDWTAEQAMQFVKQHAKALIAQVTQEIGDGSQ